VCARRADCGAVLVRVCGRERGGGVKRTPKTLFFSLLATARGWGVWGPSPHALAGPGLLTVVLRSKSFCRLYRKPGRGFFNPVPARCHFARRLQFFVFSQHAPFARLGDDDDIKKRMLTPSSSTPPHFYRESLRGARAAGLLGRRKARHVHGASFLRERGDESAVVPRPPSPPVPPLFLLFLSPAR